MANTVFQFKRSIVPGKSPDSANLQIGELALNLSDKRIFSKHSGGYIVTLSDYELSNVAYNTSILAYDKANSASSSDAYNQANSAYIQANTAYSAANSANTWLQANDGITLASARTYTDNANTWLRANDATTLASARSYTDSANTWLRANDATTLASAKSYADANDATTLASARSYTLSAYTQANAAFNQANTANTNAANASFLTVGTVNTARLGSGTANANTYLAGDNTWKYISPSLVTSVAGKTGNVTLTPADVPGTQSYHGFVFPYEVGLSYSANTRIVTFTPTGSSYDVWVQGVKYTKIGAQTSIAHANTTGAHFLYYNNSGDLEWSTSPWDMKTVSPAAYIYYDTVPMDGIALFELHTYKRNPEWHESQHFAIGTFVRSGLEISGYTLNADGNTSTTFQIAAGIIVDEDIEYNINTLPDNGPYTIIRRTGASNYTWNFTNPVPYLFGPTYVQYNQNVGGVWQMTETVANKWVNYYLYAATALDTNKRLFLIPGQAVHSSLSAAQGESNASLDLTGLSLPEVVAVWKITLVTGNSFSADGRVRIVEVVRITNTRGALSVSLTTTSHNLLTGRDALDSHPATAISFTSNGTILSANVQGAISELDADFVAVSNNIANLTSWLSSNVSILSSVNDSQNNLISLVYNQANSSYIQANIAYSAANSANTWLQANDVITLAAAKNYANSNDATTLASAKLYADANDAITLTSAKGFSSNAANITLGTISGNLGVSAGSTLTSFIEYNGTTATNGQFYGGTSNPTNNARLNYDGNFYATTFYGAATGLTGSATNLTANVATYEVINNATSGIYYPQMVSGISGNLAGYANNAFVFDSTNGRLGIGTSSPFYKLDVSGTAKANSLVLTANTSSTNTTTGTLVVTGGVGISGALNATTKSFDIPHPSNSEKRLRYGSLESPSHSVRLTGKGSVYKGTGIIRLPEYFKDLVHKEEINIQITNIRHGEILWVEEEKIEENYFVVGCNSEEELEFYWSLTAERADVEKLVVEY